MMHTDHQWQKLNAGAAPWWSVCSHRGSGCSTTSLKAGERSGGSGSLSRLRGSAKEQRAEWNKMTKNALPEPVDSGHKNA
ncbi:hypothetical protein D623_10034951 [Myotis brandtii]|uniref:Uncharacterized protein n=1 Tax=Myotis brandtii TaxID=109478 RepID=S7MG04_MYOBR|nr:hypothetical protein D623_10034951 [Myotis brandtii]